MRNDGQRNQEKYARLLARVRSDRDAAYSQIQIEKERQRLNEETALKNDFFYTPSDNTYIPSLLERIIGLEKAMDLTNNKIEKNISDRVDGLTEKLEDVLGNSRRDIKRVFNGR